MKSLYLLLAIVLTSTVGLAQTKLTENTLSLAESQQPGAASLKDVEWLAGAWTGTGLGGLSEEMYSKPAGGTMLGSYRMIKDGRPVFYEFVTIAEDKGSLAFRIKHFNPDMSGWEEKDKFVTFWFIKKDSKRIYFEGMTLEPRGKNGLVVYLAIKYKDGIVKEELFTYKRAKLE
jgi:hypothetical protein